MNAFKAIVAWILFAAVGLLLRDWVHLSSEVMWALLISGTIGLGIGDLFLLNAYARMGAARTMILYGFQPFFIGAAAQFLFGQQLSAMRSLAILFFVGCLFSFSLEKYREAGHWELPGLISALLGVLFDNAGVILSRWAFDQTPEMNAFQANLFRCTGAMAFFMIYSFACPINLTGGWKKLGPHGRRLALIGTALGTFLSLFLYLTAIKIGHLASVSAVAVVGPILAAAMECVYYRRRPSPYLMVALLLFLLGFSLLVVF